MPTVPIEVTPIETLMPSIDARTSPKTHVIDGRNFLFDSLGPKSGFGSDILTPFPISAPLDLQGLRVQGRTFVATQDALLEWRDKVPFTWDFIQTFDNPIPTNDRWPWSGAYMDGSTYFAQKNRGLYRATEDPVTGRLVFTPLTYLSVPGLIEDIVAIVGVRNRMVLINADTIQWSNTADMSDLTPEFGGAGFQDINTFTKGTFVAVTEFQDGFTVWTTEGSVVAEYIGGDAVWRFYPGTSKERPLAPWCTTLLASGVHVMLSEHGLFTAQQGQDPQPWTPDFNEYLQAYITPNRGNGWRWRIEYDDVRQTLYVMESNDGLTYWRSYVLSPTRNKWGLFSKTVYGMLPMTELDFGFASLDQIPRVFNDGFFEEISPLNEVGYDRHFPRFEKRSGAPSSSMVSRAINVDLTGTYDSLIFPRAAYYERYAYSPAAYGVGGLDSWIEIGYVNAPQLKDVADALPEIQEISFGSTPEAASLPIDFTNIVKAAVYFPAEEDWNYNIVPVEYDIWEDLNTENGFEDLNSANGGNENFNELIALVFDESLIPTEDWNVLEGDEDWGSKIDHLNPLSSRMTVISSVDGSNDMETVPTLARFNTDGRLFTTIIGGTWHKVRIEARDPFEYFHVKYLSFTFEYGGQLI